jgi:hypothetical protein
MNARRQSDERLENKQDEPATQRDELEDSAVVKE